MPGKESYLVRDGGGRMYTVTAHSVRGALKLFLAKHRRQVSSGDYVSIKPRGHGDWVDYKVS
jgi:hypothetical protein